MPPEIANVPPALVTEQSHGATSRNKMSELQMKDCVTKLQSYPVDEAKQQHSSVNWPNFVIFCIILLYLELHSGHNFCLRHYSSLNRESG